MCLWFQTPSVWFVLWTKLQNCWVFKTPVFSQLIYLTSHYFYTKSNFASPQKMKKSVERTKLTADYAHVVRKISLFVMGYIDAWVHVDYL